jgi:hypothetical protein
MSELNWRAKGIGTIAEFFSVAECDEWIRVGESKGFEDAPITNGARAGHDERCATMTASCSTMATERGTSIDGCHRIWRRVSRRDGSRSA